MGKPTGFLEFPRVVTPSEDPKRRLKTYGEILRPASGAQLTEQAARCMNCGIPFCQSDHGCPLDNLIPEWNDLVYRGLWREASERLHATNNFPEFTGRVCPAPCEGACVLGLQNEAVTIENLEQAIVDRAFAEGWVVPEPPQVETGMTVAIVGSGPAGLSAAQQLRRVGHDVTVFERADRIGGLLHYGIPNMKLDKSLVQRRVDQLRAEGVLFETNTNVSGALLDELHEQHDAVLLATGATKARDLIIPGRDLPGVHFAMELLTESTAALMEERAATLSAEGKKVLVIGGGDTGTDCIATVLRQGCASLTAFEIMPRPPEQRSADNAWPNWPQVFRTDYGHREAQALMGEDPRRFAVLTKRFVGEEKLEAVETVHVRFEDGVMKEIPGSAAILEVDQVFLAMGFTGPELIEGVAMDGARFGEGRDGRFVAGDCRRGQSLVVWAIAEGRSVARNIDEYLMGSSDLPAVF